MALLTAATGVSAAPAIVRRLPSSFHAARPAFSASARWTRPDLPFHDVGPAGEADQRLVRRNVLEFLAIHPCSRGFGKPCARASSWFRTRICRTSVTMPSAFNTPWTRFAVASLFGAAVKAQPWEPTHLTDLQSKVRAVANHLSERRIEPDIYPALPNRKWAILLPDHLCRGWSVGNPLPAFRSVALSSTHAF